MSAKKANVAGVASIVQRSNPARSEMGFQDGLALTFFPPIEECVVLTAKRYLLGRFFFPMLLFQGFPR